MIPEENELKDLEIIEGTIESITYQSSESGYTVCDLSTDDALYTVVGTMPDVIEGEMLRAYGKTVTHPTYGEQFRVSYYERTLPASTAQILSFLENGAIKGIGPALARRIVGRFKDQTFDVIENHPEWLTDVKGISAKGAKEIGESFRERYAMRSLLEVTGNHFSPAATLKIYNQWGAAAVNVVRKDPYLLCTQIDGITFAKSDELAASLKMEKDCPERKRAGILHLLKSNANGSGHTLMPLDKLIELTAAFLEIDADKLTESVEELKHDGEIVLVNNGKREYAYLKEYYDAEKFIARKLHLLDKVCPKESLEGIDRLILQIESEEGIEYAPLQRRAILFAINNGVMLLTGGPGTGKTTIVRAVVRIMERMGLEVVLAAPTGRAAKRLSEATQSDAQTIHRLLESTKLSSDGKPHFNRDENNLLDADAIIIDETSMIDTLLCDALLKAVKPGARVIFIGDADQLPSVGAGNVLRDLLRSDSFCTVALHEIFRQAQESRIVTNAHAVNNGELPVLDDKKGDFFFLPRENETETLRTIVDLCLFRLPKTYGEDVLRGLQVISPSRKGNAGTETLNKVLQSALNPLHPTKKEYKDESRSRVFRVDDKVMQIKNNYDLEWTRGIEEGTGIFNGDIGTVVDIDRSSGQMTVLFDDKTANYDLKKLEELEHAYAITVHKSQGSEYPIVLMPVYPYSPKLLTRNLLYTAITRAQKMVIMVGNMQVVQGMVENNLSVKRYSGLALMIRKEYEEDEP